MDADEGLGRLRALGFGEADAQELWAHFDSAERRGKQGHGHARIPWLEALDGYDPAAEPALLEEEDGFQRWHGRGAIGYLVLGRVVRAQLASQPAHARLVVCERTFPTGMLGHYVRRLADGGLVGALTANSPRAARPSGRRSEARGHESARDRNPEQRTATRSSRTSRWGRSRGATSSPG